MKACSVLLSVFLLSSSAAEARWRWRDADPFNRNGGLRRGLRHMDPSQWFNRHRTRLVNRVAYAVANTDVVKDKAERDGWTKNSCRAVGGGIITTVAGFQSAAICAAFVAGEPVSATTCVGLVLGAGATLVEATCTQLCHDGHLRDC
jgi:hypothetical protein